MPSTFCQFIFYGGKGGVGKTTCAAARAVAEARRGARVLAVSTDPAHSLGDALDVRLSARVTRVPGPPAFHAIELDAPRAFARWIDQHRDAVGDIVAHGTWLDRDDIDALLGLSLPGVDELMGLLEIVSVATRIEAATRGDHRSRRRHRGLARAPDVVIVDTAPTGHMLRLLAAPDAVAAIAGVFDALQEEHRIIRREFGRLGRPEAADHLIELLVMQAAQTRALLRDRARTTFEWVMLPENLSLAESEDGIGALRRAHIHLGDVIVNRVLPAGAACPTCDRRRVEEWRVIARIRRTLGKTRVRMVPAQPQEPRGVTRLDVLGRWVAGSAGVRGWPPPRSSRRSLASVGYDDADGARRIEKAHSASPEAVDALRSARLLFFVGKGGVGKTTTAAATALRLAGHDPSRRVLLLSTDPAHSLADVFAAPIGDVATGIRGGPKNLRVRELDARAALAARRAGLEAALEDLGATFGASGSSSSHLLDLAPPGIDELFALLTVTELTERFEPRDRSAKPASGRAAAVRAWKPTYDLLVVDTAPTGHALRLLEMPDVAREWVQLLMRVQLKYRSLVRPGRFAQEIVDLSQSIRRLQTLLRDPEATRFVVVTRAAEVPRLETNRLLDRLRRLQLATPVVVANALTLAPRACPRCRATMAAERRVLSELGRRCRSRRCAIIQAPLVAPPPIGRVRLERWASLWIA